MQFRSAAWERQRTKPKGLTEAEVKDRPPRDAALACPYPGCGKLLRDAVKTPCCQTLYCEDCIHTHLLDRNFECPKCKHKIASLDKLKIDSETRAKVREYVRNAVEESRKEAEAAEGTNSGVVSSSFYFMDRSQLRRGCLLVVPFPAMTFSFFPLLESLFAFLH